MLSMTLRSYLRDPRRPVVFLPVYFGYERLIEGKTYIGELSGQPKEKESLLGLLRTLPALRQRFGKVHVSFGEPIRLDDDLCASTLRLAAAQCREGRSPPWLGAGRRRPGARIMTNINSAACVAPINLIALALLATPKQSMLETDLVRQLELYASLLRQAPYSLAGAGSRTPTAARSCAMASAWACCSAQASARRRAADDGRELGAADLLPQQRAAPDGAAVAGRLLLPQQPHDAHRGHPAPDVAHLSLHVRRAVPALARGRSRRAVLETLDDMLNHGLLESVDGGTQWRRPPTGSTEAVHCRCSRT